MPENSDKIRKQSTDPGIDWIVNLLELVLGGICWFILTMLGLAGRLLYCLCTGKAYQRPKE